MVIPTRRSLKLFRVRVSLPSVLPLSLPFAQTVHIYGGVTMRTHPYITIGFVTVCDNWLLMFKCRLCTPREKPKCGW